MEHVFDIVVVGGGLVGTASAVALAREGHQVAIIENRNIEDIVLDNDVWDSRIYVISPGNAAWLAALGVWGLLDHERVCSIRNIEVWGDLNSEPLELKAYEANVAQLGFVVENQQLQKALWSQLKSAGVKIFAGTKCAALDIKDDYASIELADQSFLRTKLVVAADGANSWTRDQTVITVETHDYQQTAVVANFETELSHHNIARQWFSDEGVLAFLPLPGRHISMVWSTTNDRSSYLLGLKNKALANEVRGVGRSILGKLRLITPAVGFPLNLQTAQNLVSSRLVLIGDAAHQIHPLAGQGVNLGFRDAAVLTRVISERRPHQDMGDFSVLRNYERERRTDMLVMKYMTHGLNKLFSNEQSLIKSIRNWGMRLTDSQPTLKKQLIRRAMI